jgi:prepilin-type N-terminal cleavage/methylation domain-containing protein
MSRHTRRRAGFTLIEMLVVMFFIVILATLVVALGPRIADQSRAARGADQLQGALLNAKMLAKRQGHAVGIRLQVPIVTHVTAGAIPASPPGPPPTPMPVSVQSLTGTEGNGVIWSITPGSRVLVTDDDHGANPEVVQVATTNGVNSFTAIFSRRHAQTAPGSLMAVRLLGYVTNLQYIEQPDDFVVMQWPAGANLRRSVNVTGNAPQVRPLSVFYYPYFDSPPVGVVPNGNGIIALLEPWEPGTKPATVPDFSGGLPATEKDQWPVQPGDYLELSGGGQVHQITGVNTYSLPNAVPNSLLLPKMLFPSTGPAPLNPPVPPQYPRQSYAGILNLATLPANQIYYSQSNPGTTQWRIIRAPRVMRGEEDVQLPQSVVIDLGTNYTYGNQLPVDIGPSINGVATIGTGNVDILFSPSGAVVSRGAPTPSIILWVRDTTRDSSYPTQPELGGTPTLVTTYKQTGFIAAHPVDINGAVNYPNTTPYTYTQDGRSSGM